MPGPEGAPQYFYIWLKEPQSHRALESSKLSEQICYGHDHNMCLVLDALTMTIRRRKPNNSPIILSDRGSQFVSDEFVRWRKDDCLSPSMSRRGNYWNNAVSESFFSSLKSKLIKIKIYPIRSVAKSLNTSKSSITGRGVTSILPN